jgi:nitrogen fixation protein NifQ
MEEKQVMEEAVTSLLRSHAVSDFAVHTVAPLVAKKSLMMNHLYQDLGFKNRVEMGAFMKTYFPVLAAAKPKDKLWKKYLYDLIGTVAPACFSCKDQAGCFACKVEELKGA